MILAAGAYSSLYKYIYYSRCVFRLLKSTSNRFEIGVQKRAEYSIPYDIRKTYQHSKRVPYREENSFLILASVYILLY